MHCSSHIRCLLVFLSVLLGPLVAAPAAWGQTFTTQQSIGTINGAQTVVLADFDGDGDLDAVGSPFGSGNDIKWFEHTGSGGTISYGAGKTIETVTSGQGWTPGLGTADLDQDGDPDLLAAKQDNATATYYENQIGESGADTDGFGDPQNPGSGPAQSIIGTDLDGDGDPDLVWAGNTEPLSYAKNTGGGGTSGDISFNTEQDIESAGNAWSVEAADLDGDGDPDLLVGNDGGKIFYVENTTDGGSSIGFASKTTIISNAGQVRSVVASDLDGDGDPDVASASITNETVAYYENQLGESGADSDGFGSQQVVAQSGNDGGTHSVAAEDMDGDGDPDLVVGNRTNNRVNYYENTGHDGTSGSMSFAGTPRILARGVQALWVDVGDLDGDGDSDVASADDDTGALDYYVNGSFLTVVGNDGNSGDPSTGTLGGDAGWRFISFPKQITRGDLNDDFNYNFDNLASGHAAYVWDETTSGSGGQQWTALTSDSDNIGAAEGVALFYFDDTDDPLGSTGLSVGANKSGDPTSDVSLSGLGQGQFLFIGNPYLSAYDLSSLDITSSDFSQTVQIYDPAQGSFVTRDRSNSETVAAMQGFVVERLSPGSGPTSLTFSSAGVQNGTGSFIGSKQAGGGASGEQAPVELALTVESAEGDTLSQDQATVRFDTRAEVGWDAYEATQLTPPQAGSYATLSSPLQRLLGGDSTLARRTLAAEPFPEAGQAATVPLSVRSVDLSGTATIALQNAPDAAGPLELVDTEADQTIDLREQEYTFDLAAGDGEISDPSEARFQLRATSSALPVELAGFTAERDRQSVRLTWRTASETGNAGFAVQHRREMQGEAPQGEEAWTQIGFVEGSGTTDAPQRYHFRTGNLSAGTHRFRLKQVDTDGSTSLSEVVTVEMGLQAAYRLTAPAPNPTTSGARLQLTVRETQPVRVAVYDVLGREVSVLRQGPLSGQAPTTLRAGRDLPAGTYFVRATGETFTATRRLTIVR